MNTILKLFTTESLFDACTAMLRHLHIEFNEVTRTPVSFESLYPTKMSKSLCDILSKVDNTYFIGTIDEASLSGNSSCQNKDDVTAQAEEGRYVGMMVFAVDIHPHQSLTRTELSTLTRGFNRIAAAQPVVLFIRLENQLALSTCERSEYTQQWRDGEKLGRVSLLRGINCNHPHRGHIDILESIGDKAYPTFEELYKHWMQVFSSELLTKKFYSELSDWYAWAVQVARFPNDISNKGDDEKYNHENCIRLITRLIFVWFLKQKRLIPEEFFDEEYIQDHYIANFNPHDRDNLLYNSEQSKYYRLILQNLFFAMLNRTIVPEGKDTPNNRQFRGDHQFGNKRDGYNVNNLMRYQKEFKEGGADEFLKMANNNVPFLNGGLFDCLDDKPKGLYYDGFSERTESLEQLYLPDWLFFGDEVGRCIDLSKWYGDVKKKKVSARGIIDILKRYNFTIEENTPLDQEVSLDPELLGKAFENLLAAYNPETKTSARKQTGSFYTPREIVQYMVDESLVAYLKRICGEELEPEYRKLLSYSTEETSLCEKQRKVLMQAIYNCRVLDPACGSGAFPMGVLQQMVHVLRQLDPTNEMWKDFMIDIAIEQSRKAFSVDVNEERQARLADIEDAFNRQINDPDYARKLYLIEHCIFGVDIQPIAVQISKLRFFISLVVDQKPTSDATHNFGIRPLPNLESKFVAANTLIPVEYNASLFESTDAIVAHKERLKELNHAIFLAKRNADKQRLKEQIKEVRRELAKTIEDTGYVNPGSAQKLAEWDMFEQNTHEKFFDAEWMFGVKGGFDIVIANPPYIEAKKLKYIASTLKGIYDIYSGTADLSIYFIEFGLNILKEGGELTFITTNKFFTTAYGKKLRHLLLKKNIHRIVDFEQVEVFENVLVSSTVIGIGNNPAKQCSNLTYEKFYQLNQEQFKLLFVEQKDKLGSYPQNVLDDEEWSFADMTGLKLKEKIENKTVKLGNIEGVNIYRGVTTGYNPAFIIDNSKKRELISEDANNKDVIKNMLQGRNIRKWYYNESNEFFLLTGYDLDIKSDYPRIYTHLVHYRNVLSERADQGKNWWNLRACNYYFEFEREEKIIWGLTADKWAFTLDKEKHYLPSNGYILTSTDLEIRYILGLLNSKLMKHYFSYIGVMTAGGAYTLKAATISSLPFKTTEKTEPISSIVDEILSLKEKNHDADVSIQEQKIDYIVYHLYNLTYDEVLIIEPNPPFTREEYEKETK